MARQEDPFYSRQVQSVGARRRPTIDQADCSTCSDLNQKKKKKTLLALALVGMFDNNERNCGSTVSRWPERLGESIACRYYIYLAVTNHAIVRNDAAVI